MIVDDHPAVLKGMKVLFEEMDYEVVATALNEQQFFNFYATSKVLPDIVFMDIKIPDCKGGGARLTKEILQQYPELKVIGFSSEDKAYLIKQMVNNGANAYISKSASPTNYNTVINKVLNGESTFYFKDIDAQDKEYKYYSLKQLNNKVYNFNDSQVEFLCFCTTDLSYADIGKQMNKSEHQIEYIRKSISDVLGICTRQELAIYATNNMIQQD